MKRWFELPKGLRGQLILLLLGALVAAQIASLALILNERARAVRVSTAKETASRLLNVARELEANPEALHAIVLRAAESRDLRLSLDMANLSKAEGARQLGHLAERVTGALASPPARALGIALGIPTHTDDERRDTRPEDRDGDPYELVVSTHLADGRWLNAHVDMGGPPLQWAWPAVMSLLLTTVAVVLVVWFVIGRIAGPVRALVDAADRLGRAEELEPLPLSGPAELRQVTGAFNDMAARLLRLLAERSRMLAAIGHDLRSPITAMRIRLEMLDDEESRQRLQVCVDEIQSLVEAALALARGASAEEPQSSVNLRSLLEEIIADLRENGAKASLTVSGQVTIAARPGALKRALRNLAENAIRYGREARISLNGDSHQARIEIEDKGPGIAKDDRERVFEPFVRLEASRSRDTGGAGLGLAIARTLIEAHRGSIVLEDGAREGTRAVVTLPIA
ncbi:MAG: ATP-binding protein [Alphaproteobacteria bacterium]